MKRPEYLSEQVITLAVHSEDKKGFEGFEALLHHIIESHFVRDANTTKQYVETLLHYDTNIGTVNGIGETPLHIALTKKHNQKLTEKVTPLLIKATAEKSQFNFKRKAACSMTVLHHAANGKHEGSPVTDLTSLLLKLVPKARLLVNIKGPSGNTSLMVTVGTHNHVGTIKLIEAGADVRKKNRDGFSAKKFAQRQLKKMRSLYNEDRDLQAMKSSHKAMEAIHERLLQKVI